MVSLITAPLLPYAYFSHLMASSKTALIIGATGLVGHYCLQYLLQSNNYEKVIALTRRPVEFDKQYINKLDNLITDFENLEALADRLKADDVFCAMGTTIGKAGSQAAFKKIDYEIPLQVAKLAHKQGAKKFILVSSIGADSKSMAFYTRVKGEIEEAILQIGYESIVILRPSILLGKRSEMRIGESVGQLFAQGFSFLFAGPLAMYKGIPGQTVAKAMVNLALKPTGKKLIVLNKDIFKEAKA
jgi:uncharacterized protein YbjT (DUF2867 family)